MGKRLTDARVSFVRKYADLGIVDIGIGGGAFVRAADCFGYDVNANAIKWLKDNGKYKDPYNGCDAITCWDSLEHIRYPDELLRNVRKFVFVSIPIFRDVDHVLSSKHFKPGEHVWYFTHEGLVNFMKLQGFDLLESNAMESDLGREGINSYAFKRADNE